MTTVDQKIQRVENGLMQAISVVGEPVQRHNLQEQMKVMNVPGVSVAVINEGEIEWVKTYGVISSEGPQEINEETRFQAGSVSKPVAAHAILSLVNQHQVDPDMDINTYLTSWKVPDNEYTANHRVTLRHLLSHTSGFSVIGFDGYVQGEKLPTTTQTLDGIAPANNLPIRVEFASGTKMSYSGGGYNVAQQLVEDVTEIPFSQFMEAVLLHPLKMDHSTFECLDVNTAINVAYAHPANRIHMSGGWKNYPESAAAGLWTTATDLARWLIHIQKGLALEEEVHILDHDLLVDMVTPQVAVHGLGPVVNGEGEYLELSFKGRTDGFTCAFVSFPYLKKGAVIMINAGNEFAFIDAVLRSIACEYQWPSYRVEEKEAICLSGAVLDRYVGRYGWGEVPSDIYDLFLFYEQGQLYWKMGLHGNASKLYAQSESRFFSVDAGYDFVFAYQEDGCIVLNVIVQKGYEREFRKF